MTGTDADDFDIDWATGQLKTKAALDFETKSSYTVIVRATDPTGDPQASGDGDNENSDTVMVDITITDVNEPPAITGPAAVPFNEDTGNIATALGTYPGDNPEDDNVDPTWSVAGADSSKFNIGNETDGIPGELKFKAKPDYEMPTDANADNVYEVTVRVADADGNIGTMDVKVTVSNEDEDGVVTLSKTQPRVGVAVTARVTDPDGSISGLTWQWYDDTITDTNLETNAIEDANSDTYIPKEIDADPTSSGDDANGVILFARVSYTDGQGESKSAMGMAANPVAFDTRNKAPVFEDQDTETDGVQNTATTREVEENAKADSTNDAADDVGRLVIATDPDPNDEMLTYTLGGADAAKFRVRDTGQIEVGAGTMLDYETKTSYMVTVMAEDSFGSSASIMVTIIVTDVDEEPEIMRAPDANVAPEFASATTNRTVAENTAAGEYIGNLVAATDNNGDALTYALSGTDAASFDIDPDTGQLMTQAALDYETKATYSVTVTASDSGGLSDSIDVTITVTNVEEVGMLTGDASDDYAENGTAAVGTYTADGPVAASWSLEGDDMGAFSIGGSSGELMFASPPDFEAPTDMGMDNMYQVTVKAEAGGEMDMMDVTVTVTNVEEVGMLTGDASDDYAENGTAAVGTYTADGPVAASWSLEGDDMGAFSIGGSSGELMFASPPDFEAPTDMGMDNMYQVTVKAEAGGEMDMMDVTVTVTNVEEVGMLTGDASDDYAENGTAAVGTYTADGPVAASWSLEGDDMGAFSIGGSSGELMFASPPDFEAPTDMGMDNMYQVTVKAEAGGEMDMMDVTVTVTNVEEVGMLTGDASDDYAENGTAAVGTYTADGPVAASWSLEGDDMGAFSIGGSSGELMFASPPDFEAPTDMGMDNMYQVTVKAEAGGEMDMMDVTVTVTNVEEVGMLTGDASDDYAENGTAAVGTYTADGPVAASWSLEGDDMGAFSIGGSSGELMFASPPDFEAPTDMGMDNMYQVTVKAEAGGEMDMMDVTVTVTNVEEVGMLTGDASDDYAENGTAAVGTYTADGPVAASWSLEGDDMGAFSIGGSSGELMFASPPDFEAPTDMGMDNMYQVTVKAEAGGEMDMMDVTVTVTNVEEQPVVAGEATSDYPEKGEAAVAAYTGTDPEGVTVTWSLSGDDAEDFEISEDGMLTFKESPNFEAPADMDTNNVYMVTVEASDGTTDNVMQAVTVTVTNVDEPGMVTLWAGADALTMAPQVGDTITGLVVDPDGTVTGEMWQWSRTMDAADMSSWMDIPGATDAAYMVMEGDTGYHLRVMATYTDAVGTDMAMEYSPATMMTAPIPLLVEYDPDGDGVIEKADMRRAVGNFLGSEPTLSRAEMRQLVGIYFSSS